MSATKRLSTSIAIATFSITLAIASSANAKETRSASSLPKASSTTHRDDRGAKGKDLPRHVGPKKGWPDNHGIENAWEHANEHSAHHRNDSEG